MIVYVVVTEDRHVDPDVQVFMDQQRAIDYAEAAAEALCRHGDEPKLLANPTEYLWFASVGPEGDRVWIVERETHV